VTARTPRWTQLSAAGERRSWWLVVGALLALGMAVWALWPAQPAHVVRPASPQLTAAPGAPAEAEPPLRSVHIVSSPEHASIGLRGLELGQTPYDFQFRRDTELTLNAPGHQTYLLQLSRATAPNVVVELVKIGSPQTMSAERARPLPRHESSPVAEPVVAPPPAPSRRVDARSLPPRERRQALLASGPPYRNVDAAKRAYRERRIDESYYDDIVWALKARRNQRITAEKRSYRQHAITRDEYARRVKRIDQEYEGP
jgi:hypothetical protein